MQHRQTGRQYEAVLLCTHKQTLTTNPPALPKHTCKGRDQNRLLVCTNWPTSVGRRGSLLNTGASVTRPWGLQKPDVVQSVSGHSPPRSCRRGMEEQQRYGGRAELCSNEHEAVTASRVGFLQRVTTQARNSSRSSHLEQRENVVVLIPEGGDGSGADQDDGAR